jgi:uncharacterized protein YjeT (DUF2065 family)
MFTGFKTYIGIIVYLIGLTGLANFATPQEWETILGHTIDVANWTFQIVGALIAIVGIVHKDLRLKKPV